MILKYWSTLDPAMEVAVKYCFPGLTYLKSAFNRYIIIRVGKAKNQSKNENNSWIHLALLN